MYAFVLYILVSFFSGIYDHSLLLALILWLTAINVFILGHAVDGNVAAMTAIVGFKYVKSILLKKMLRR